MGPAMAPVATRMSGSCADHVSPKAITKNGRLLRAGARSRDAGMDTRDVGGGARLVAEPHDAADVLRALQHVDGAVREIRSRHAESATRHGPGERTVPAARRRVG